MCSGHCTCKTQSADCRSQTADRSKMPMLKCRLTSVLFRLRGVKICTGVSLDKGIRKKLLQESKLTLQSCIDICRANECTKQQLGTMDRTSQTRSMPWMRKHRNMIATQSQNVIRKVIRPWNWLTASSVQGNWRKRSRNVRRGASSATNVVQKIIFLWFAINTGRSRRARNGEIRKRIVSRCWQHYVSIWCHS